MKIYLEQHSYQFAVEQTVMTLCPTESIETVSNFDEIDKNSNYLRSTLEKNMNTLQGKASCFLNFGGKTFECHLPYTIQSGDLEEKRADQFAIKESIYQAVVQTMDKPPLWGNLTGVRPVKLVSKLFKESNDWEEVEQLLKEKYHIQELRTKIAVKCAKVSCEVEEKLCVEKKTVSLYVGIPFCPSRCAYCSFFSSDIREKEKDSHTYVKGLLEEISQTTLLLQQYHITVSTVYVGGGTPTVLSEELLEDLLQLLQKNFPNLEEFTVEAGRPDTLNLKKIEIMERFGVSRISINPQTMSDHLLQKLQRNHTVKEVKDIFSMAKDKFTINMDLIMGLPEDTKENFFHSLDEVVAMKPSQITVHCLTPKKNTALEHYVPSFSEERSFSDVLDHCWTHLEHQGYLPYYLYRQKKMTGALENVGWALNCKGKPLYSPYNVAMMEEFQTIIGCGSAAMTKCVAKNYMERLQNPKFYWEYLSKLPEILNNKAKLLEEYSRK